MNKKSSFIYMAFPGPTPEETVTIPPSAIHMLVYAVKDMVFGRTGGQWQQSRKDG